MAHSSNRSRPRNALLALLALLIPQFAGTHNGQGPTKNWLTPLILMRAASEKQLFNTLFRVLRAKRSTFSMKLFFAEGFLPWQTTVNAGEARVVFRRRIQDGLVQENTVHMEVQMKKFLIATALAVIAGSALAAAHFVGAEASVRDNGALVVSFDEVGLGNGNVDYTLSANGAAVYACFNKGGKHPAATNKVDQSALDDSKGTFQSKNGRVRAILDVGPPGAGTFSCPSGQDLVLACVKYTNVVLTDDTNKVTPDEITGTFARKFRTSLQQCSTLVP